MKRIEKARRIIDRVFYFVIILFSMYCLSTFVWLMSEVIGNLTIPNTRLLEGLTSGFMVLVAILVFITVVDYILKERQKFLYNKFGSTGK